MVLGAAPAEARWTEPEDVPGVAIASGPVFASNHRGLVLMAWAELHSGIRVAFTRGGDRFGPGRLIPGSDIHTYPVEISAALAPDGTAVVAWNDCRGEPLDPDYGSCHEEAWAALRRPGHSFGGAKRLSDPGLDAYTTSTAATRGRATVTYTDNFRVFASAASPHRPLGSSRRIAAAGLISVTFSPGGVENFLFTTDSGIKAVQRLPSGRLLAPRFASRTLPSGDVLVRGDARGRQAAIWDTNDRLWAGVRGTQGPLRVKVVDRSRGETVYDTALASAPAGRFLAAFNRHLLGSGSYGLRFSTSAAGSRFSVGRPVPGTDTRDPPNAAIADGGAGLISWLDRTGGAFGAIAVGRDGHFSSRRLFRLSEPELYSCGRDSLCDVADVALDGRGHGYMAWADGIRLRVARYRAR
jgi:hypothetical protein